VTPSGPVDGPLAWNVAGLLGDEPGAERTFEIHAVTIDLGEDLRLASPIEGRVRLLRTNRGILAAADLDGRARTRVQPLPARRRVPVESGPSRRYLPALDSRPAADRRPTTSRTSPPDRPPRARLETPVREAIQLAEPIAPLCRPDCPGLCIVCGCRLDEGSHDHPDEDIDPRLEALRGFRPYDG
jgi:uncharacterized protein